MPFARTRYIKSIGLKKRWGGCPQLLLNLFFRLIRPDLVDKIPLRLIAIPPIALSPICLIKQKLIQKLTFFVSGSPNCCFPRAVSFRGGAAAAHAMLGFSQMVLLVRQCQCLYGGL